MKKRGKKEKISGRKLALTIILGVFISIMLITLFNLIVTYFYEEPNYNEFCGSMINSYPIKMGAEQCLNCTFSPELQNVVDNCTRENGIPSYNYDERGCSVSLKDCDQCNKNFETANQVYNRNTFFIYAAIGFALIVAGLFVTQLLLQIIALPAGAFLVIESAVKNFDDKLYIIITFTMLIIAAVYLALKKLK